MIQRNYADQIVESAEDLYILERKASAAIVRDRLRFLRLLKNGSAATPMQAGAAVSYKKAWSYQLWNRYAAKGLTALRDYPFKGTRPRMDAAQQEQFKASLATDQMAALADAADVLKQQSGISYTTGGMSYVLKRMGIKKKTGRPTHVHKDEQAVAAFKKKHRNS